MSLVFTSDKFNLKYEQWKIQHCLLSGKSGKYNIRLKWLYRKPVFKNCLQSDIYRRWKYFLVAFAYCWRHDFYFLLAVRAQSKGGGWKKTGSLSTSWLSRNKRLWFLTSTVFEIQAIKVSFCKYTNIRIHLMSGGNPIIRCNNSDTSLNHGFHTK